MARQERILSECETGRLSGFSGLPLDRNIKPDTLDVVNSLLLDASALDFSGFADWSADFGFDADSIKARAIYDACIACGLALRAGLGDAMLQELRDAFSEY